MPGGRWGRRAWSRCHSTKKRGSLDVSNHYTWSPTVGGHLEALSSYGADSSHGIGGIGGFISRPGCMTITADYYRHPKIRAAAKRSPLAVALDVAIICYCADNLTEGVIDQSQVFKLLPRNRRQIMDAIIVLEKVRRLHIVDESSWRVHGFMEHHPTADRALARRQSAANRKRRQREREAELSRRDMDPSPYDQFLASHRS